MTTRRQVIRIVPALPLMTAAGATALLAACGEKKPVDVAAPPAAPTPAPAPVAAAPTPAATPEPAPAAAPASPAAAVTGPLLDEKDPAAVGLGYVADATKADKTKYAQYVAGSACSNCALYQGAAGSAQGGCPLFAGNQVSAKGWCSAWAKKAA